MDMEEMLVVAEMTLLVVVCVPVIQGAAAVGGSREAVVMEAVIAHGRRIQIP